MTARVNRRHARSEAVRAARKICGSGATLPPVEDYQVRDGAVAVSIDLAGFDPATVQIEADRLSDIVASMDRLFVGWPYQRGLSVFAGAFRAWKGGDAAAQDACLAVYWLVLRHPSGGAAMRRRLSDALRRDGKAHITFHGGAERGIAFALAPSFCELGQSLVAAKGAGIVVVEAERDAETFQ